MYAKNDLGEQRAVVYKMSHATVGHVAPPAGIFPLERLMSFPCISPLIGELSPDIRDDIDMFRATELMGQLGLAGAARVIGYNISDYSYIVLAGRMAIKAVEITAPRTLAGYCDVMSKNLSPVCLAYMRKHAVEMQAAIDEMAYTDMDYDWPSANTLITTYSERPFYGSPPVETPRYMWMRVATQLYMGDSLEDVLETFREYCTSMYTPASPTMANAAMVEPQMASCFLMTIADNLEHMLRRGVLDGGMMSKGSGGLGIDMSRVRHSSIGTKGMSRGIMPVMRLFDDMINLVRQGSLRNGAGTLYCRAHHIDIEDFIRSTRKIGDPMTRLHKADTCIWMPWLFWERVRQDGWWTLTCPNKTKWLNDIYGKEWEAAYIGIERQCFEEVGGRSSYREGSAPIEQAYVRRVKARDLLSQIISMELESGKPYIMSCDSCNLKSNHKGFGYLRGGNLCTEIVEYMDDDTVAVCNLHSMNIPSYVIGRYPHVVEGPIALSPHAEWRREFMGDMSPKLRRCFDFDLYHSMVRKAIRNLCRTIDNNWYPLDSSPVDGVSVPGPLNKNNKYYRPVALGVQGFWDAIVMMRLIVESRETALFNDMLFTCHYWSYLCESIQQAILHGRHGGFEKTPMARGELQFDLWAQEFKVKGPNKVRKESDDIPLDPSVWGAASVLLLDRDGNVVDIMLPTWDDARRCVMKHGCNLSLGTSIQPTASSSIIKRNTENVEISQSNLYSRRVLKGTYPMLNRHLVTELKEVGLWGKSVADYIKANSGSVKGLYNYLQSVTPHETLSHLHEAVEQVEKRYATVWEISQKNILFLAAGRARSIDQSMSLNVHMPGSDPMKLEAWHLLGDMLGHKTIVYYARQRKNENIKFTVERRLLTYVGDGVELEREDDPPLASSGECIGCI